MSERSVLFKGGSRGMGEVTALLAAQQGWSVALNQGSRADAVQALARPQGWALQGRR